MFSFKTVLIGFAFLLSTQALASFQDAPEGFQKVYGPEKVFAGFPKNKTHKFQFETAKPNEQFFIRIVNGNGEPALKEDCKKKKGLARALCEVGNTFKFVANELFNVDKVSLEVNGKKVLKNENFKKIQTFLDVPVQFKPSNKIEFSLKGSIVSFVQVLIFQSGQENQMPIAAFTFSPKGDDEPLTVTFDASGSQDRDGQITTYAWQFGDGQTAEGVQVEHTYEAFGEYSVILTVTDDRGATAQSAQVVSIFDEVAPVLAITQPADGATIETEVVEIAGTSNEALSLAEVNGQALALSQDKKSFSGSLSFLEGNHTLNFAIEDLAGNRTEQAISITVNINLPPVANFGFVFPESTNPGLISLGSQASDPDGSVVEVVYDWGDGNTTSSLDEVVTHTYSQQGTFQITQTVKDNENGVSSITKPAVVSFSNQFPKAILTADRYSGPVGTTIHFDAGRSFDPDGSVSHYQWRVHKPDGTIQIVNNNQPQFSHTFSEAAIYRVRVRVMDNQNAAQFDEVYINIGGIPGPQAVISVDREFGGVPFQVNFNGSESLGAAGQEIDKYLWSFADGGIAEGLETSHVFQKVQIYPVRLTVTTANGLSSTTVVEINALEEEPTLDVELKITQNGQGSREVTFFAKASPISADTSWSPESISYTWSFGDGGTGASSPTNHTYSSEGPFVVNLEVADNMGNKGFARRTIYNVSEAPNPENLQFLLIGDSGQAPHMAMTDVRNYPSAEANFKNFIWSFDGQLTDRGPVGTHSYLEEGTYSVKVLAQSLSGFDVESAPKAIVIEGRKQPVQAAITVPSSLIGEYREGDVIPVKFGDVIELSAHRSESLTSSISEYIWTTPAGEFHGQNIYYVVEQEGLKDIELLVKNQSGEEDRAIIQYETEACIPEENEVCPTIPLAGAAKTIDTTLGQWTIKTNQENQLAEKETQAEVFSGLTHQSWVELRNVDDMFLFYNLDSTASIAGTDIVIDQSALAQLGIPLDAVYKLNFSVLDQQENSFSGVIEELRFGFGSVQVQNGPDQARISLSNPAARYFKQVELAPNAQLNLAGLPAGPYRLSVINSGVERTFSINVENPHQLVDLSAQPLAFSMTLAKNQNLTTEPYKDELLTVHEVFALHRELAKANSGVGSLSNSSQVTTMQTLNTMEEESESEETEEDMVRFRNCVGEPNTAYGGMSEEEAMRIMWDWDPDEDPIYYQPVTYLQDFSKIHKLRLQYDGDSATIPLRCTVGGYTQLEAQYWMLDAHKQPDEGCCGAHLVGPGDESEKRREYESCINLHRFFSHFSESFEKQVKDRNQKKHKMTITIRDPEDHGKQKVVNVEKSFISAVNESGGMALMQRGYPHLSPTFDLDIQIPANYTGVEMKVEHEEENEQYIHCSIFQHPLKRPKVIAFHSPPNAAAFSAVSPSTRRFANKTLRTFPLDFTFDQNIPTPEGTTSNHFHLFLDMKIAPKGFKLGMPDRFGMQVGIGKKVFSIPEAALSITDGPSDGQTDTYRVEIDLKKLEGGEKGSENTKDPLDNFFEWQDGVLQNFVTIGFRGFWEREGITIGTKVARVSMPTTFNLQKATGTSFCNDTDSTDGDGFYSFPTAWGKNYFIQRLVKLKSILAANHSASFQFRCNDIGHPFGGRLIPHSETGGHTINQAIDLRYFRPDVEGIIPQDDYDRWPDAATSCPTGGSGTQSGKSHDLLQLMSYARTLHNKYFEYVDDETNPGTKVERPNQIAHFGLITACFIAEEPPAACSHLTTLSGGTYPIHEIHLFCYALFRERGGNSPGLCNAVPMPYARRLSAYVEANRLKINFLAAKLQHKERVILGSGNNKAKGISTCLNEGWHKDVFENGLLMYGVLNKQPQKIGIPRAFGTEPIRYLGPWADRHQNSVGRIKYNLGHDDHFDLGVEK